jgi:hypothetical protein
VAISIALTNERLPVMTPLSLDLRSFDTYYELLKDLGVDILELTVFCQPSEARGELGG